MTSEVGNPFGYPYSSVVYIRATFANGVEATGSGTLIGPNDVLTAQHVVHDASAGGLAVSVEVSPGRDLAACPFICSSGYDIQIDHDNIVDTNGDGVLEDPSLIRHDYALIGLEYDVGSLAGTFGINRSGGSGEFNVTGYPSFAITDYNRPNMYQDAGTATHEDGTGRYIHDLNSLTVSPGYSGGPLWKLVNGSPELYGVISTVGASSDIDAYYDTLVTWMAENDALLGGQTIIGGSDADTLSGTPGRDTLSGGAGDDHLTARGPDLIFGNQGADVISLTSSTDTSQVFGGTGNDSINSWGGGDLLFGNAGDDYIFVQLNGTPSSEENFAFGGLGNDTIRAYLLDLSAFGGAGDDSIIGSARNGGTAADYLIGGAGNDTISGDGGSDRIYGNQGDDLIFGSSPLDFATSSSNHNDTVYGGQGSDTIYYGDVVYGNLGNDVIHIRQGSDVYGGQGSDTFHFTNVSRTDTVNLYGNKGSDVFQFSDGHALQFAIHDFDSTAGDRFQYESSSVYFDAMMSGISQDDSGNAVLNLSVFHSVGGTLTLIGIAANSVDPSWFTVDDVGL